MKPVPRYRRATREIRPDGISVLFLKSSHSPNHLQVKIHVITVAITGPTAFQKEHICILVLYTPVNTVCLFSDLSGLGVGGKGEHFGAAPWAMAEVAPGRPGEGHVVPGRGRALNATCGGEPLNLSEQNDTALATVERVEDRGETGKADQKILSGQGKGRQGPFSSCNVLFLPGRRCRHQGLHRAAAM